MNNTFCISFSDNNFQLLNVSSRDGSLRVDTAKIFTYPATISLDQILLPDNLNFVSDSIEHYKKELSLPAFSLSFVLPFNFAEIKKILLPADNDTNIKRQQIQWELETTLSDNIANYKISILKEIQEKNHIKAIVVAIKKKIINNLQIIAEKNSTDINNVLLNCFSLENYLLQLENFRADKNYVFLKIDKNYLEYHFFCGDKYILSQIDLLNNITRKKRELIVETTKERYKNISNFFEKESIDNPLELIIYGSSLDQDIFETLTKGISSDVTFAKIEGFPIEGSFKFIETWGSFL